LSLNLGSSAEDDAAEEGLEALEHCVRNLEVGDGITVHNRRIGVSDVPDRCGDGRRLVLAENCSAATARLLNCW
jgi:hypothetical protein